MTIEIRNESHRALAAYATVPITFEVREIVDVAALHEQPGTLATQRVTQPYVKDYDTIPSNDPLSWPTRFETHHWIVLGAFAERRRVGGAIVVVDAAEVEQLGGRPPFALLWDLRVAPDWRRRGLGRTLLGEAETAARAARCVGLEVETQDVNVAACRLYAASGYTVRRIVPAGYEDAPDETKLLWVKLFV